MRVLGPEDVRAALPMTAAIEAMRSAFGDDGETPQRVLLGNSLFMPGRVGQVSGIKVVSTVPGNPMGLVVVFGPDGQPLGLVDGPALTAIRTGAGCGLATDLLARRDVTTMAMLGAGAMAFDQVAAVRAVRDVETVLVWSRSIANAERLAAPLDGGVAVADADEAVAAADIVTTATPSAGPLFQAESVRVGSHINAIGAFTPTMCELPPLLVRSAFVTVDDRVAAAAEAGDLLQADVEPNTTIGDLLAGKARPPDGATTVFKSVGIASQDVAAATTALRRAAEMSIGTVV